MKSQQAGEHALENTAKFIEETLKLRESSPAVRRESKRFSSHWSPQDRSETCCASKTSIRCESVGTRGRRATRCRSQAPDALRLRLWFGSQKNQILQRKVYGVSVFRRQSTVTDLALKALRLNCAILEHRTTDGFCKPACIQFFSCTSPGKSGRGAWLVTFAPAMRTWPVLLLQFSTTTGRSFTTSGLSSK